MPAVVSGFLLTAAFPKLGLSWLAWFALLPLLFSLRNLSWFDSFRMGFLAGVVHYLTLLYWLVPTMHTYGHLPLLVCIPILFLLAAYIALYMAFFSLLLTLFCRSAALCLVIIPVFWVSVEYARSTLFTGFPWGLLAYSQSDILPLIQISDITGPYGVSFLIAFSNATLFLTCLYFGKKGWKGTPISKRLCTGSITALIVFIGMAWLYGEWRIDSVSQLANTAPSARFTIVQGNISQAEKWDEAFTLSSTQKYIDLSLSAKGEHSDLIVWPETATPFYFLYDKPLTQLVRSGIQQSGTHFLIGSPSFAQNAGNLRFLNSAYLIGPDGNVTGKYDKAHLVPFGEYVPLKKFMPFLGKMVAQVGDFEAGQKGRTIGWQDHRLGIQICFEIIFPQLSRLLAKNHAALLVNITNDAWFGSSSGPYQHFAMTVFRAVENKKALVRSANTGISGFIDPVGRIENTTPLFKEATQTQTLPLMQLTTFYSRFGDVFASICLAAALLIGLKRYLNYRQAVSKPK